MKNLLVLLALLITGNYCSAQYKFLDQNSSNEYNAKIFVANYSESLCNGKATILLLDKISETEVQVLKSPDLEFSLTPKQNPKLDWVELGKYQSPLVFGDFDFDGNEDLAVRNGNNGAYNSPSFDVYLFNKNKKAFELNKQLTELASGNLGMFNVDRKNKQLSIDQKDGCCLNKTINYTFDIQKGLTEVGSVIEDSRVGEDVVVITQKIVNGKTQRTVQKFKTKEYYKEQ